MSSTLQIILMYLLTILILLFTVTIHEMGHLVVGILSKVNVKEVSIGIGPKITSWKTKSGMRVSLKWIPLVAYVLFDSQKLRDLYKEEPDDKDYNWYMEPCPKGKLLLEQTKTWQYLLIMFAGVMVNFIAFFILWPICLVAFKAYGQDFYPFWSLGQSLKAIGYDMVFKGGAGSNIFVDLPDLAGSALWGLIMFQLLVMMNLITGVFNLIPFPPLDGWKIFAKMYTASGKRKISEKTENILSTIGLCLMLYIFISSILVKWIHW